MTTQVEKRVAFEEEEEEEEEEALSLCNFPLTLNQEDNSRAEEEEAEDFEFFGNGGNNNDMCAADEVFFQGQILPLRPSTVSSDCSNAFPLSRGPSRCSSVSGSLGFESSSSGRSSSVGISRSHSTDSSASGSSTGGGSDAPRASISSNFYSHPSPKPHLPTRKNVVVVPTRRKSVPGSGTAAVAGLGLFRFGLVRAPEMEVAEMRQRNGGRWRASNGEGNVGKKVAVAKKVEKKERKFFGNDRFSCKCSPDDALEPNSLPPPPPTRVVVENRRREEGEVSTSVSYRLREEATTCQSSRTFLWLQELPVGKAPVAYN